MSRKVPRTPSGRSGASSVPEKARRGRLGGWRCHAQPLRMPCRESAHRGERVREPIPVAAGHRLSARRWSSVSNRGGDPWNQRRMISTSERSAGSCIRGSLLPFEALVLVVRTPGTPPRRRWPSWPSLGIADGPSGLWPGAMWWVATPCDQAAPSIRGRGPRGFAAAARRVRWTPRRARLCGRRSGASHVASARL